jgi:multicomponent Na+:H+ antiporter subunit E
MLQDNQRDQHLAWGLLRRGALRATALALLWWVLTDGDRGSWVIGVPGVVSAALASLMLVPGKLWRWRLAGMLRFIPFFLRQSVRGGLDVSIRALHPHTPLAPAVQHYRLRLHDDFARVFFANTVSLLPGSLSADLQHDRLTVHVLDGSLPIQATLQALEVRVAGVFGVELAADALPAEVPHE